MLSKIRHTLSRLDLCTTLILVVVVLFILVMLAGNLPPAPVSAQSTPFTPTPESQTAVVNGHQATPIPAEYLANNTQTNGIVFGTVLLVMIVVIGTLSIMWRNASSKQKK
ncbi:hypothetical protein [Longilinea arvoryzae]|nr:hypothetical protein [Longilinea arvoryzae]